MTARPDRFVAGYRAVLLTFAVAWHSAMLWPPRSWTFVVGSAWLLAPYVALAALPRFVRSRAALVLAAAAHVAMDVLAGLAVLAPASSTAPVAAVLVPVISLAALIPVAAVCSWRDAVRTRKRTP